MKRGISFSGLVMGMLWITYAARAALMPVQIDTFWHLRAGADIWRTGAVPRVDSYSFTAAGWPWRDHEWLWQPFSYACHRLGGLPLLTLAAAAFVLAGVALSHRLMVGRASIRFSLLLAGLPLMISVWAIRPHVVTLLALPLLITLVVRGRTWPIPLLFIPWANAHGGVALGGLMLLVATGVALLRWGVRRTAEDRRRAGALVIVLALSGLATLVTPLGLGIVHFLSDSMRRIHAIGIGEWRPAVLDSPLAVAYWIVAGAFLFLVVKNRRALRDGHASTFADWVLVACALVVMPMAFAAVRNIGVFVLLAMPAASRLLGPGARLPLPARLQRAAAAGDEFPRVNLLLLGVLGAAAIGLLGWNYRFRGSALGWHPVSARAIAAVRACPGPLYNQYDEGGYLLWFVPERPVFVDGRQDPYPLSHILSQLEVQWGRAPYRPLFDRWGIRCAFVPATSATAAALERDGWITRHRDDDHVVLSAPPDTRESGAHQK